MDDTDFIEERETVSQVEEKMRLRRAFGDDVAQRFLRLRGIDNEVMRDAVLVRYAMRQAAASAGLPQ